MNTSKDFALFVINFKMYYASASWQNMAFSEADLPCHLCFFLLIVHSRAKSHQSEPEEEEEEVKSSPPVITSEFDIYDDLYDAPDEEELDSLDSHGSIIKHLLSQVNISLLSHTFTVLIFHPRQGCVC